MCASKESAVSRPLDPFDIYISPQLGLDALSWNCGKMPVGEIPNNTEGMSHCCGISVEQERLSLILAELGSSCVITVPVQPLHVGA